jgi:hypothetical protein
MSCNLHFVVCSYNKTWNERAKYCPECRSKLVVSLGMRQSPEEIYQVVPGEDSSAVLSAVDMAVLREWQRRIHAQ